MTHSFQIIQRKIQPEDRCIEDGIIQSNKVIMIDFGTIDISNDELIDKITNCIKSFTYEIMSKSEYKRNG